MAEILYACLRDAAATRALAAALPDLLRRLEPGNIAPNQPTILRPGDGVLAVFNPTSALRQTGASVCAGEVARDCGAWHAIGSPPPTGTFAIFRAGESGCECLSDEVGTRKIWYVQLPHLFAASTSQRLITMVLGDFEINEPAISWMIATGSPGFMNAWDRRVRALPAAHRLRFDARQWCTACTPSGAEGADPTPFPEDGEERFARLLDTTLAGFAIDGSRWALPLSGGVDSRGLLFALAGTSDLRCFTWGEAALRGVSGSDAYIAEQLARTLGVRHEFLEISPVAEDVEVALGRFVACSEGLIDHVAAYVDGFAVWKRLFEAGIGGVIRGDHVFGRPNDIASDERVRRSVGLHLLSDYQDLRDIAQDGLPPTELPDALYRLTGETRPAYRERLARSFRIPVILAALNKLKTPYVEVFDPWLSRPIIEFVKTMPDDLRNNKRAFRDLVASRSRGIPFATVAAMRASEDYLEEPGTVAYLRSYLDGTATTGILGKRTSQKVLDRLGNLDRRPSSARRLKRFGREAALRWLPEAAIIAIKRRTQTRLGAGKLAFRAFLIERSATLFKEDAAAGRQLQAEAELASG